ncbi:hypothetical protein DFJ73DRAFT_879583 [Zopfochytrium polystomum]|nr:hypothetical protein DFJ73DRAFT_879583 [Zopfochytrium polystomum]
MQLPIRLRLRRGRTLPRPSYIASTTPSPLPVDGSRLSTYSALTARLPMCSLQRSWPPLSRSSFFSTSPSAVGEETVVDVPKTEDTADPKPSTFFRVKPLVPENLKPLLDLSTPAAWYPEARKIRRTIHLHVGPPDSAKGDVPRNMLRSASSGLYVGPYSVHAREFARRMKETGFHIEVMPEDVDAALSKIPPPPDPVTHWAASPAAASLEQPVHTAVIDECQVLADASNGHAWTRLILGLPAENLYVCGPPHIVDVVSRLAKLCGDEATVTVYERRSELRIEDRGLRGSLSNVVEGDCLVTFAGSGIFALRKQVESFAQLTAAIVYEGVPPEVRLQQVNSFNDQQKGHKVLVTTDAVTVGMVPFVRRIIFGSASTVTEDLSKTRQLPESKIYEVGNLAGRFRTSRNVGYVVTLTNPDLKRVTNVLLSQTISPLEKVPVRPTLSHVQELARELPDAKYSEILKLLSSSASVAADAFVLADLRVPIQVAEIIDDIPKMRLEDRFLISMGPVANLDLKDRKWRSAVTALGQAIADGTPIPLIPEPDVKVPDTSVLDILNDTEIPDEVPPPPKIPRPSTTAEIHALTSSHALLLLHLHLHSHHASLLPPKPKLLSLKARIETKIAKTLENMHNEKLTAKLARKSYGHKVSALSEKKKRRRAIEIGARARALSLQEKLAESALTGARDISTPLM